MDRTITLRPANRTFARYARQVVGGLRVCNPFGPAGPSAAAATLPGL